ncbi:Transmembrane protein 138 [Geodia barretti]|uniref:Transmembrane protein 138 n=1 Tax=Geodia barretti TaxID=519541 RepID=A0AA35WQZ8_GEOBA|nr:Transmembrane protein 138 [Geodia barretti]
MPTFLNPRYSVVLALQLTLLAIDVFCNAFMLLASRIQAVLVVLVIIQDIALVACLVLLLLAFFNTIIFKAGLISVLFRKFSATLLIGVVYLVLTVVYQIWFVAVQWNRANEYNWTQLLQTVYVLHRLVAVVFYYMYKRAALRLGDSQYYEDSPLLRDR